MHSTANEVAQARGDARPCALASLVEKTMQKDGAISEQESERFRDVTAIAFLGQSGFGFGLHERI